MESDCWARRHDEELPADFTVSCASRAQDLRMGHGGIADPTSQVESQVRPISGGGGCRDERHIATG
jgi:hypothetical protein